jgi:hypothetical protein
MEKRSLRKGGRRDATEEVRYEMRLTVRIIIYLLNKFRRNLDQSELDLLGDDSIFPRLRESDLAMCLSAPYDVRLLFLRRIP